MRIFYDTEFIADGRTIDLISIALVTEDGRGLYRIVGDTAAIGRAVNDPWLRGNVVPHLPVTVRQVFGEERDFLGCDWAWEWNEADPEYEQFVWTTDRIREDVKRFIRDTTDPQLWAWYAAYDHVAYAQLFGRMIDLPMGFPTRTGDLKQEAVRLGDPQIPPHTGRVHHAYDDALHDREIAFFLDGLKEEGHRVASDPWQ